jgi:hypothetical protein
MHSKAGNRLTLRSRTRRGMLVRFAIALIMAGLALTLYGVASASTHTTGTTSDRGLIAAQRRLGTGHIMAAVASGDFGVVLTSSPLRERESERGAIVELSAYRRVRSRWQRVAETRIENPDSFDWSTVGGNASVRDLSVGAATQDAAARTTFEVLMSTAVGWTTPFHYHLLGARLSGGPTLCGCEP